MATSLPPALSADLTTTCWPPALSDFELVRVRLFSPLLNREVALCRSNDPLPSRGLFPTGTTALLPTSSLLMRLPRHHTRRARWR